MRSIDGQTARDEPQHTDTDAEGAESADDAANAVEPGMGVETTDADLGERDPQGQMENLVVGKGAVFRKEIEVPAERIEAVAPEPRAGAPHGEVTIGARAGACRAESGGNGDATARPSSGAARIG